MNLEQLGWNDFFRAEWNTVERGSDQAARVVAQHRELWHVAGAFGESRAEPSGKLRVAVEEGSTFGWERYTGLQGAILGMHTFGLSAPMQVVAQHFGFDVGHVVSAAKAQVAHHRHWS